MEYREYRGLSDLQAMCDLLSWGRKAGIPTYYPHRGDLQWWLFYNDDPQSEWKERARLWMEDDRLIGWSLLTPFYWHSFDVYIEPSLRGTDQEHTMLSWAVDQLAGEEYAQTVWVAEDDEQRIRWLTGQGFAPRKGFMWLFHRALDTLPELVLPEGFVARPARGLEDLDRRALAQHDAFESSMTLEDYIARMRRFFESPVFMNDHNPLIVNSQGDATAFTSLWTDDICLTGYIEPFGVHPSFHRKGLGRALMVYCLQRLRSEGMISASVTTHDDNEHAICLYESVGFKKVKRLLTFRKDRSQ